MMQQTSPTVIGKAGLEEERSTPQAADTLGDEEAGDEEAERESLLPAAADAPKKAKSKDPKSRVAELEAQLTELKKKLDARPIVFQFAGADGADGAMTEVEGDMTEAEDAEAGG